MFTLHRQCYFHVAFSFQFDHYWVCSSQELLLREERWDYREISREKEENPPSLLWEKEVENIRIPRRGIFLLELSYLIRHPSFLEPQMIFNFISWIHNPCPIFLILKANGPTKEKVAHIWVAENWNLGDGSIYTHTCQAATMLGSGLCYLWENSSMSIRKDGKWGTYERAYKPHVSVWNIITNIVNAE